MVIGGSVVPATFDSTALENLANWNMCYQSPHSVKLFLEQQFSARRSVCVCVCVFFPIYFGDGSSDQGKTCTSVCVFSGCDGIVFTCSAQCSSLDLSAPSALRQKIRKAKDPLPPSEYAG